eukprot:scaffold421193_cov99-Attheya_sp.AAC.2
MPKDFGGHETIGPRFSRHEELIFFLNLGVGPYFGQTKVRNFEHSRKVNEQIGRLEISMDNGRLARVQIIHSLCQLLRIVFRRGIGQEHANIGVPKLSKDGCLLSKICQGQILFTARHGAWVLTVPTVCTADATVCAVFV